MDKKIKRLIWFIVIGSALLIAVGWFSSQHVRSSQTADNLPEEEYWEECVQEDTELSYSKYLIRFPEGKYADEAKKQIGNN